MQHTHISSKHRWFDYNLKELWQYRGLIWLFTKRSFVVTYKQTILGPAWLFLMPLMTSLSYVVLFGNIARLSTDGIPQLLFYMAGNAVWSYFAACLTKSAGTFIDNAYLFGKVYFPRLVIPLSNMLGNIMRFLIQMIMVLGLLAYYAVSGVVTPRWSALIIVPLVVLQLGILGMGIGIIVSSLTTRYRDLNVLVGFGVTLWMYATPVVYPLSSVRGGLRNVLLLNPVTQPMELFRYALAGQGTIVPAYLAGSVAFTAAVALAGVTIFNKIERTFVDTV